MNIDLVAYLAGILTTYAFWPQVVRVWKTKQTRDLSLGMYVIFTTGVGLWITYGWLQGLYTIIVPNVITFVLSSSILYCILRNIWKKNGSF